MIPISRFFKELFRGEMNAVILNVKIMKSEKGQSKNKANTYLFFIGSRRYQVGSARTTLERRFESKRKGGKSVELFCLLKNLLHLVEILVHRIVFGFASLS